jgi:hypothetical protein
MMKCKRCGRKRSWPNFKVLSWNLPGGTEEIHKTCQDCRSPSRDLKTGPPECEAGVLITRPQYTVRVIIQSLNFEH